MILNKQTQKKVIYIKYKYIRTNGHLGDNPNNVIILNY